MKKILKIFLLIFGILFTIAISFTFYLSRGIDSHESIEISDVNIIDLSNGIYTGHYSEGRWRNTVEVTVNDGQIKEIKPLKTVLFEKEDVSNEIFKRVIHEQKITVDTITGATVTSKAYLKAIENALNEKQ